MSTAATASDDFSAEGVTPDGLGRQTGQVMTQDQLEDLVARAGRADPDAWEALYRRVYPGLLAYASRRLDRERARDAVAETMARAIARIDRFEWRGGGFDAWLYGILRHVVVDAHRARGRDGERRERSEPRRADPLEHVLDNEDAREVRAAFARLPADDRELLELRVVAGLSAEEVGEVLGKRAGAVRMAQSRALERLRRELERSR
jgi:RNA polymerase sigma-70 factor (ECF subfamily)